MAGRGDQPADGVITRARRSVAGMTESQRRLRRFGGMGLAAGLLFILGSPLSGDELVGLLRGYGTMLAFSAAYLLGGLWLLTTARGRRTARLLLGVFLLRAIRR